MENIEIKHFNPNPKCKNPHVTHDCLIRAICKLTKLKWEEVYDRLYQRGRELGAIPNSTYVAKREFKNTIKLITINNPVPTIAEFILNHKIGSYIICTYHHSFALIDGIIYDSIELWDQPERYYKFRVYKYFILKNKE